MRIILFVFLVVFAAQSSTQKIGPSNPTHARNLALYPPTGRAFTPLKRCLSLFNWLSNSKLSTTFQQNYWIWQFHIEYLARADVNFTPSLATFKPPGSLIVLTPLWIAVLAGLIVGYVLRFRNAACASSEPSCRLPNHLSSGTRPSPKFTLWYR